MVARDFFDILPEMKDEIILNRKCSVDKSCLGNRFRAAGHLILIEDIFQVVNGFLAVIRHGEGDEMMD